MTYDVCDVPISHFTSDALNVLNRLNARRLFLSDGTKLPRDWRGLANLVGITVQDAENKHENMVKWILETWLRNDERAALVHQLFRHLETIDRYDIRDDLQQLAKTKKLVNTERKWTTENQVSRGPTQPDNDLLTMDDVDHGAPVEYDALVLYAAADQDFVDVMISHMTQIGFRLFTKHSLRPGVMPYGPMTELISSRCRHTILVYSPAFFESLDDKFYTDYVLARNIEKKHTMIPCIYQKCELPPQCRYYHPLYVTSLAYNFWDRLARCVDTGRTPKLMPPLPSNSVRIQELTNSGQLRIANGNQLQITNGQIPNGRPNIPNGYIPSPPVYVTQPPSTNQSADQSSALMSQPTTTTIALPDVPSTTLSISVTTLVSEPIIESASLNDLSKKKKKKSSFSFLKKLKLPRKNKSQEALLASK